MCSLQIFFHSIVSPLPHFLIIQSLLASVSQNLESSGDNPVLFWAVEQSLELNLDVSSGIIESGQTEIRLQKLSENAREITFNFDWNENKITRIRFREGWGDYDEKNLELKKNLPIATKGVPLVTLHIKKERQEKGHSTLELHWKRNITGTGSLTKNSGKVITFEKDEIGKVYPFVSSTKNLTKYQVIINLSQMQQKQKNLIVLSNGPSRNNESLKIVFRSETPMLPHQIAFAFLDADQTQNFSCPQSEKQVFKVTFYTIGHNFESQELQHLCTIIDFAAELCMKKFKSESAIPEIKFVIMSDFSGKASFRPGLVTINGNQSADKLIESVVYGVVRHWTNAMTNLDNAQDLWFEEGITNFLKMEILRNSKSLQIDENGYNKNHLYMLSSEPGSLTNKDFLDAYQEMGPKVVEQKPGDHFSFFFK